MRVDTVARVVLAIAFSAPAVAGQTPASSQAQARPIITSSTELVEVDVVVTDHKGAPVRGLTRGDFKVSEDGRAQPIETFGFIDISNETRR